jgi:hypothetical protein
LSFVYLEDICIYSETREQDIDHLRLGLQKLREHQLFIKIPKTIRGQNETEHLGITFGNGTLRTSPNTISVVKDWPLLEIQIQIKAFVLLCSYYYKFLHHFSDCAAPLTDMCRNATKVASENLKSRMISAPVLLIPKMGHEAKFFAATNASKVGIDGVLLQEDTSISFMPFAH